MDAPVLDPTEQAKKVRTIMDSEANNHDEVWDGEYFVSPAPNDEHQEIVMNLGSIFNHVLGWTGLGLVRPGVNVSDRVDQWEHNFRYPDVVVYLKGTKARNLGTHWVGGPDFAVEVVSRDDRSRDKLDFYAKIGTLDVLLIDRFPWSLELYRLQEGVMILAGTSTLKQGQVLASAVLPFTFQLLPGEPRPRIDIRHTDGIQRWSA